MNGKRAKYYRQLLARMDAVERRMDAVETRQMDSDRYISGGGR